MQLTALLFAQFLFPPPTPTVDTKFVQVAPPSKVGVAPRRSAGQSRAVVLLHGFRPHPFINANALHPELSSWEEANSAVVKAIGRDADVFALGYAQNRPVDEVARAPVLQRHVESLHQAGYTEVVFIGYSAGALVARYYVENMGDRCGVNKVIQVCPPNGGTSWGKLTMGVRQSQEPFILSLTKEARQTVQGERTDKLIPAGVEFVCVVGSVGRGGDGMVRYDCQWTRELQLQGIPAVLLFTPHVTAMRSKTVAERLVELVREPQPRWTGAEVEAARLRILREK
jgi:pimeloyl-ACP methyl ester carboxylesterase